jgi:hypothetical protein
VKTLMYESVWCGGGTLCLVPFLRAAIQLRSNGWIQRACVRVLSPIGGGEVREGWVLTFGLAMVQQRKV